MDNEKSEAFIPAAGPGKQSPETKLTDQLSTEIIRRYLNEVFPAGWTTNFRRKWPDIRNSRDLRTLFGNLQELLPPFEGGWPKVDVVDRGSELLVRAELPGVKRSDIDVSVTALSITIKAKSGAETTVDSSQYFRRELMRGEFERTLHLRSEIDAAAAQACLKDGVLELVLPKLKGETSAGRSVPIQ